jgi:CRISPR/Cas system-associated exonuclease Cas4 (RecB family)
MRTIRASEFVSYLYCQRAWWYQLKGKPSENQAELAGGSEFHRRHGRQILLARLLEMGGWGLILLAVIAAAVAATMLLLH